MCHVLILYTQLRVSALPTTVHYGKSSFLPVFIIIIMFGECRMDLQLISGSIGVQVDTAMKCLKTTSKQSTHRRQQQTSLLINNHTNPCAQSVSSLCDECMWFINNIESVEQLLMSYCFLLNHASCCSKAGVDASVDSTGAETAGLSFPKTSY